MSGLSSVSWYLNDVCVNSYLPLLAMGHERVIQQTSRKERRDAPASVPAAKAAALLTPCGLCARGRQEAIEAIELSMSNFAMALGFGATLVCAAATLGLQVMRALRRRPSTLPTCAAARGSLPSPRATTSYARCAA